MYIEVSGVLKHVTLYKKLAQLAQQSLLAAKQSALNFVSMRPTARPVTVSGGPSKLAMKSFRQVPKPTVEEKAEKLAAKSFRDPAAGGSAASKLAFKSYRGPAKTEEEEDKPKTDKRPSFGRQASKLISSVAEATGEAYIDILDKTDVATKGDVVDDITGGNSDAKAKIMELLKQIEKDEGDDESDVSDSDSDDEKEE